MGGKRRGTLLEVDTRLAEQFVRNFTRPEQTTPAEVYAACTDNAEFRCVCGATYVCRIRHALVNRTYWCAACRKVGKSRLEYEVAALLRVVTQLEVVQNYGAYKAHRRVGSADLYLPKLDAVIQIDPYHTHFQKYETDLLIFADMQRQHLKALRVREEPLPVVDKGTIFVQKGSVHIDYATAICNALGLPSPENSPSLLLEEALCFANKEWDTRSMRPVKSVADSSYAAEFVRNLSHPGRSIEYTAAGGRDVCEWKCSAEHSWEVAAYTRARDSRCPTCRLGERYHATPGRSLLERNPTMARFFVNVKTESHEAWTAADVNAASMEEANWFCPECKKAWTASLNSQYRKKKHSGTCTTYS